MSNHRHIKAGIALALVIAAIAALAAGPTWARINSGTRGTPVPAGTITASAGVVGIATRSFAWHPPTPSATAGGGASFHWGDAGVGAAITLLAVALLAPAAARATRSGKQAHPA